MKSIVLLTAALQSLAETSVWPIDIMSCVWGAWGMWSQTDSLMGLWKNLRQ